MLSAFLPKEFDPKRPLALIAGRGRYPVLTAAAIRAAGVPLRLIAMDDETEPELIASFSEKERVILNVGQVGKMLCRPSLGRTVFGAWTQHRNRSSIRRRGKGKAGKRVGEVLSRRD